MRRLKTLAKSACVMSLTVRFTKTGRGEFASFVEGLIVFDRKRECGRLSWAFKGLTVTAKSCRVQTKTAEVLLSSAFPDRCWSCSYWVSYKQGYNTRVGNDRLGDGFVRTPHENSLADGVRVRSTSVESDGLHPDVY